MPDFASSQIARRGWRIFQQIVARDIALRAIPSGVAEQIDIALVRPGPTEYIVRFSRIGQNTPSSLYDVSIPLDPRSVPIATRNDPPAPLLGADLAQWHAQAAWVERIGEVETCAPVHQIVAFPADDSNGWLSYLVPMPDSPGFMQLGGFYVLRLDETAENVIERRALNSQCGGWHLPTNLAGFAIAQAETRVPVESDVYSSLIWDVPLFVSNAENDTVWAVDDAGVTDVTDQFDLEAN